MHQTASCTPCQAGTEGVASALTACTPCQAGFVSGVGSTKCEILEHDPIVLTITGSIDSFLEGSERRRTFLSSLALILDILENQIVILSIKSGSIIVELAFIRDSKSTASPLEATSRLKTAVLEGTLEKLGALDLKIGGQSVNPSSSSSASLPLVIGSSTAATVVVLGILIVAIKYRLRHRQKVQPNEALPPPPPLYRYSAPPPPVFELCDGDGSMFFSRKVSSCLAPALNEGGGFWKAPPPQ